LPNHAPFILKCLSMIWVAASSCNAAAESRLAPRTDFGGAGAAVHLSQYGGGETDAQQLQDAGIHVFRSDLFWDSTERVKGRYNWALYDQKLGLLAAHGIRPLLILDYSNPLYTGQSNTHIPPRTPEEIKAFATWAAAAVAHFKPLNPIWEIWNEPDIKQFWAPQPKVEEYLAVAEPTCAAIRQADPDATIIGPALAIAPRKSNFDSQVFLRLVLRSKPLMECLDAISFHPYRDVEPETVLDALPFYQSLAKEESATSGIILPYAVSEWGYSTYADLFGQKVTEETQAAYAVRQQLVALLAGFSLMVEYNWRDRADKPGDRESNFGLIRLNLQPKPAYTALAQLNSHLGDFRLIKTLVDADGAFVLAFQSDSGEVRLAAWTLGAGASVTFTASGPISASSMYGKSVSVKQDVSTVSIPIGGAPTYVDVGSTIPIAVTVTPL
jgi:hypothetical protein